MTESINEEIPPSPEIPSKKIQSFESAMIQEIRENYTIKDWVSHPTFIISAIIGVIIIFIAGILAPTTNAYALKSILPISIPGTIALISISTAGFIAVNFANIEDRFIHFLRKNNIYFSMLFLFYEPVIIGIVNIVFAIVVLVISYMFVLSGWSGAILLGVATSLFLYTILGFLNLYKIFWMFGTERLNFIQSRQKEIAKSDTVLSETHDE